MPTPSCLLPVIILATALCASASTNIVNLRCESKPNPLGIDIPHPRLSWQMQSDQRGQSQSAYQITVTTTDNTLLWDSGKVQSDQSLNIEYAGPELKSGQTCSWKVIVWNQAGQQFASDTASWEMGLLHPEDWKAKWIDVPSAQNVPPTTRPATTSTAATKPVAPFTAPPMLMTSYVKTKAIKRARLYVTALGLYEFSINDTRVGDIVFAPDWTDYHKRVEYQTYDVTLLLHDGENYLNATIADGWYSGKVGWLPGHAYGQRPALLAQLMIDYADGTHDVIATDQTWKAIPSRILRADLLDGEDYYGREITSFHTEPVSLRSESPLLQASIAPPVRKLRELAVKKITEPAPGRFTFDLGQNMVGVARLKVTGPQGAKVTLRFAEMLNPDGTIYTDNLRNARATDSYVLRGFDGEEETWKPSFTFHGFRYVEVTGYPGTPTADAITGIVIGSDNPSSGSWECSNPLLNQLLSNIVWGQRGNYISVPTDCPQRDERLGWMGDAQVFVRTATCNADVHEFFDHWLQDVSDAQTADGWNLDSRRLLHTIDLKAGTIRVDGQTYPLKDRAFPTIDPANPYELSPEEKACLRRIRDSFMTSQKFWEHMRYLLHHGSMVLRRDDNLIFHACVPVDERGEFLPLCIDGVERRGRALFDALDGVLARALDQPSDSDRDWMWYLWCGPRSPLFGKDRIATLEIDLIAEEKTHVETKNPYFQLIHDAAFCDRIFDEFGVNRERGLIVNGHVPVKIEKGESPLKRSGKAITIDGAFSQVYGDHGYTLVLEPARTLLAKHHHFESVEAAVRDGVDIVPEVSVLRQWDQPRRIADTERGDEIRRMIAQLERLAQAYRANQFPQPAPPQMT